MTNAIQLKFTAFGNISALLMPQTTKQISWLAKHLPKPEDQREYARDRCVTAFTEALEKTMHDINLTRADLAAKLGKSRGQVSRLLNGAHNMTLHTLADVLWACDLEIVDPSLGWGPLGVVEVSTQDATDWTPVGETLSTTVPGLPGLHLAA